MFRGDPTDFLAKISFTTSRLMYCLDYEKCYHILLSHPGTATPVCAQNARSQNVFCFCPIVYKQQGVICLYSFSPNNHQSAAWMYPGEFEMLS